MICRACGSANRAEIRFCEECGEELAPASPVGVFAVAEAGARCPGCGFENRPGIRFCEECGAELSATAPAEESEAEITPASAEELPVEAAATPLEESVAAGAEGSKEATGIEGGAEGTEGPADETRGDEETPCPACGGTVSMGDAFCGFCGHALSRAGSPPHAEASSRSPSGAPGNVEPVGVSPLSPSEVRAAPTDAAGGGQWQAPSPPSLTSSAPSVPARSGPTVGGAVSPPHAPHRTVPQYAGPPSQPAPAVAAPAGGITPIRSAAMAALGAGILTMLSVTFGWAGSNSGVDIISEQWDYWRSGWESFGDLFLTAPGIVTPLVTLILGVLIWAAAWTIERHDKANPGGRARGFGFLITLSLLSLGGAGLDVVQFYGGRVASSPGPGPGVWLAGALVAFVASVVGGVAARRFRLAAAGRGSGPGVASPGRARRVGEPGADLVDAPAGQRVLLRVAPGTSVVEMQRHGNWIQVSLPGGSVGWLPDRAVF